MVREPYADLSSDHLPSELLGNGLTMKQYCLDQAHPKGCTRCRVASSIMADFFITAMSPTKPLILISNGIEGIEENK